MPYRVEYSPAALRQLGKLDPHVRWRTFQGIDRPGDNPRPHGGEKLEAKDKLYRARVGPGKNYRVTYTLKGPKRIRYTSRFQGGGAKNTCEDVYFDEFIV